jgi:hypothetical protein
LKDLKPWLISIIIMEYFTQAFLMAVSDPIYEDSVSYTTSPTPKKQLSKKMHKVASLPAIHEEDDAHVHKMAKSRSCVMLGVR